jgi:hypothetical protein
MVLSRKQSYILPNMRWIEFRDDKGTLVQRMHANFNNPRFSKGHEAIDEVIP